MGQIRPPHLIHEAISAQSCPPVLYLTFYMTSGVGQVKVGTAKGLVQHFPSTDHLLIVGMWIALFTGIASSSTSNLAGTFCPKPTCTCPTNIWSQVTHVCLHDLKLNHREKNVWCTFLMVIERPCGGGGNSPASDSEVFFCIFIFSFGAHQFGIERHSAEPLLGFAFKPQCILLISCLKRWPHLSTVY